LPQSKAIPKELLPLGDKPLIHYAVEEAVLSQIEKILFIQRKGQKGAFEYFKRNKALEEILEEENKEKELLALKEIENLANNVLITAKTQRKPIGIASAIYQARDFAFKEPCAVCFSDDIIDSKVPCLEQLQEIFSTCESPVLALKKVSPDRIPSYGIVKVEKIANRFYKIKGTSEKPKLEDAPSNLAIVGRMILTEDVFDFLGKNREMTAKNVSISVALGGEPRKLNIKGENEFLGKGVGYCPVCDASFYKGEDLAIIGGGNAGLEAAIFLSCIAKNILLLERGKALLGDIKNQEKIKKLNNIKVYTNAEVLEIKGNNFVSSILWKHNKEILKTNLKAVFIQIGYIPKTELLKDLVDLNEKKEIIVNADMETKTKGLYAGGDIVNSKVKQIICAAASGAVASLSAFNYLRKNEN
jgi:thioredoxin reductase